MRLGIRRDYDDDDELASPSTLVLADSTPTARSAGLSYLHSPQALSFRGPNPLLCDELAFQMASFEGRLTRVTDDVSGIDMSCRFRGALFAIFCMFVSVRPTSAYALDFARHSIDSNKLNAILVTAEVRTGDANRLLDYIRSLPPKKNIAVYLNNSIG